MHNPHKTAIGLAISLLTLAESTWAQSVGSITYSPNAQVAVPTLSGWMLAVLGLLFGVMAYRILRKKEHGRTIASIAATGIMVLGASSGITLVQESRAGGASGFFSVATGGTSPIEVGLNFYENTSGVPQVIRTIVLNSNCILEATEAVCQEGNTVPVAGSCKLQVSCRIEVGDPE